MVLLADPQAIRQLFTAPATEVRAGASASFLEPFAGPTSILVVDGDRHLRQRRLMLPPFHGERMDAHRPLIAGLAGQEAARWPRGGEVRTLERMRVLTLEVILRAVFGVRDAPLRDAIRRALDLTTALPRLLALYLGPRRAWGAFGRAVAEVDALLDEQIARRPADGSILALLLAARDEHGRPPTDREVRDQLVTLLAAGHETTAGALAWGFERLARHPGAAARIRAGDDAYVDAVVKEVLRTRPVLSVAPRTTVAPVTIAGHELPAGVHVAACQYLVHRRPDVFADPLAFRPERWLDGADPPAYGYLPFGGGVRRCLGAAFATMEMAEVLKAIVPRVALGADRRRGERMRRRSVTLTPHRGARIVA
jgi:cytochrome P450